MDRGQALPLALVVRPCPRPRLYAVCRGLSGMEELDKGNGLRRGQREELVQLSHVADAPNIGGKFVMIDHDESASKLAESV